MGTNCICALTMGQKVGICWHGVQCVVKKIEETGQVGEHRDREQKESEPTSKEELPSGNLENYS